MEMYTSCVDDEVKSQIIFSFSSDIYTGKSFTCAPDLESPGNWTRRKGQKTFAPINKTRFCDRNMNKYQENMTLCRRDTLFADNVCVVMYVC